MMPYSDPAGGDNGSNGLPATITVTNLPKGLDKELFLQLFDGFGEIVDSKFNAPKFIGTVTFADKADAKHVLEAMTDFVLEGRGLVLRLNDECPDIGGDVAASTPAAVPVAKDRRDPPGKGNGTKDLKKGGKGGKGKTWSKMDEATNEDPTDNLYIKGLPLGYTEEECTELFNTYGAVLQCRVMAHAENSSALLRMETVEMATWLVENLHGNIPDTLEYPVSVRYAQSAASKAKKVQRQLMQEHMEGFDDYGRAQGGKGNGKGPYGKGGKGGKVMMGNLDPHLPEETKQSVDAVLRNLGGKGRQRIPHEGDQSNLYVKDLPGTVDELYVFKMFSPFGALESVSVKQGGGGAWAIAFVKFFHDDSATKALMGLNDCILPDGTCPKIQVKVKNNRDKD